MSLTHLNLRRLELGSETWGAQFREAMSVNGGDVVNATTQDYVMHFFTFAWKVEYFIAACYIKPYYYQYTRSNRKSASSKHTLSGPQMTDSGLLMHYQPYS